MATTFERFKQHRTGATYWNNKGEEQAKYDEMCTAGFAFTKKSESVFRTYYRYYNDGDLPGWARGNYSVTEWTNDGRNVKLAINGEIELEDRTTEAIRHEYKRFEKAIGRGTK